MKVTVIFGDVRILVPCGYGDLLVKDLITEATRRYKKASGKDPDAWVAVHHLQTQAGILDPDDCVRDVADDREQILASFEDSGPDPGVPQGGGDGASGSSSVGTGSPDIFRDPTNTEAPTSDMSTPHIEVTSTTSCPMTGLGLQVRRSSDPNLLASLKAEGSNKRWSAAAPHYAGDSSERILIDKGGGSLSPQWEEEDDTQHQLQQQQQQLQQQQNAGGTHQHQPFARSGRLSMQFLGDGTGYKWMEAAEKLQQQNQPHHSYQQHHGHQSAQQQSPHHAHHQIYSSKSLPRESKRKEPLGQAYESIREKDGEMLLIINEYGSPLGLTAIPDNEHGGGLLVQHVEPGSRAERGRLRRGDRILEINGIKLIGLTEGKVQEYLGRSLESSELRVRVLRADYKKSNGGKPRRRDSKVAEMIEAEEKLVSGNESKVATVSPTRKPQMAPVGTSLQVANTRKLGRKIEIVLKKGPNGLGFSVTTRDNPAGGHCPIYIKNILPRGAAIEDGRLKSGDRLLEVDGIPMTGKTQTDVVSILRATQPGATVRIVVSRQHELAEPDDRSINSEEKENAYSSPNKPPAPVLPVTVTYQKQHQQRQPDKLQTNGGNIHNNVQKSSSARSLFEQHQQQQMQQLNESQHFIDAGSESAASSDSLPNGINSRSREVLTLHIPVHDTEKAGLGVSVKGKTSSNAANTSNVSNSSMKHDGDLGIFVKNVIHGGAASRDGRLRMNDQLLSVNGVSLTGQNNAEAMETLRRAMVNNPGKHPGMITLCVARKISRSASSGDILETTNSSSNTSENSGATVIYLSPEKREQRNSGNITNEQCRSANDMNRWSNPVLDRLTGGVCTSNSAQQQQHHQQQKHQQHHQSQQQQQQQQHHHHQQQQQSRRTAREHQMCGAVSSGAASNAGLRNESYYMATHDTWSPALLNQHMLNGHGNNSVLIEDDPEPMSPTLPMRNNESAVSAVSAATSGNSTATNATGGAGGTAINFDATYSSQLSLETNNSGVEHFSRDALGRRSISEKHHAALDARETGTYQRNKKMREERERERRIQLTKSAVFGGSVESLTVRIANANAQIPGYKHAKTASSIETHQMQSEARDQVGDLGPSLGLRKSSSLESLQTMVQEIQMSDEPRGPTALRAPRGRGREDSLRAAVVSEHDSSKPRKTWLLEEGDTEGGFASQRNGPFQSSLNDGKNSKSRAKKPSILRGIGHMFRFGKNRKDGIVPIETTPTISTVAAASAAPQPAAAAAAAGTVTTTNNQIPTAALAALERNSNKMLPPAYQPPPPLPPANANGCGGGGQAAAGNSLNGGIHQNDIFNHRYQHYPINYDDLQQHQISDANCTNNTHMQNVNTNSHTNTNANANANANTNANTNTNTNANTNSNSSDVLSESTLECMRQQVIRQRIKVEAESRRHQHYHSQRSARSQDISMYGVGAHPPHSLSHHQHNNSINVIANGNSIGVNAGGTMRPMSSYYEYETVHHQRVGSIKQQQQQQQQNGTSELHSPITVNGQKQQQQQQQQQPHWKSAAMNGYSPASLNSSARSRGPFVTQVTIRDQTAGQPTYQTIQKQQQQQQQQQQQSQSQHYISSAAAAHASKV